MRVCSYCHLLVTESDATCTRDGAPAIDAVFGKVPGQVHARFPAVEPFAQGGTGSVYLAVQAQSGYRGLLKIIAPEAATSPAERARLKRELRKQTAITNSALSRIIDGGEVGNELWLFRDFVQGDSLAIRLRQRGALALPEALAITAQIASALDELHRQGLLHRDIKPGHVLLTPRVESVPLVTIIDAGIAPKLPSQSVFEILGTPDYLAPEIIAGKPASFRSDLYALGCVLYEMLSGLPPFVADNLEQLLAAQRDVEPRPLELELPAPVRSLLASLLAKEPRKRPFSAQQVRRALEPYLPPGTPEPSSGTRTLSGNMSAPPNPSTSASRPASDPQQRPAVAQHSTPQLPPMVRAAAAAAGNIGALKTRGSSVPLPGASNGPKPPSTPQLPPSAAGSAATMGRPRVTTTQEIDLADVEPAETWPESHTEEIEVDELQAASGPSWPKAELTPDAPTVVQALDAQAIQLMASANPEPVIPVIFSEPPPPAAAAREPERESEPPAGGERTDADSSFENPDALTMVKPMASIMNPAAQAAAVAVSPAIAAAAATAVPVESSRAPAPSAEAASPDAPKAPRKAVDFDVESLFDDDLDQTAKPKVTPPKPVVEPEVEDPYAPGAVVPSIPPPSYEPDIAPTTRYTPDMAAARALEEPPMADPEGTVVVQRRAAQPAPARPPLAMIVGGSLAALLVLVLVVRSCKKDEGVTATALPPTSPSGEVATGAPSGEPSQAQPSGAQGTNPSAQRPSAATANPAPAAQPSAAVAPANPAPAEPPPSAAGTNEPAPATEEPADTRGAGTSKSARRPRTPPPPPIAYKPPPAAEAGVDYKAKGRELYSAGKYKEAAAAYEKATQQSPSDAGAFAGLGASWLSANQPDKAILAYQRAVQLKPQVSGFQAALGRAYLQKNDRARAASAYRKAVELDPSNAAAKNALQSLGN